MSYKNCPSTHFLGSLNAWKKLAFQSHEFIFYDELDMVNGINVK